MLLVHSRLFSCLHPQAAHKQEGCFFLLNRCYRSTRREPRSSRSTRGQNWSDCNFSYKNFSNTVVQNISSETKITFTSQAQDKTKTVEYETLITKQNRKHPHMLFLSSTGKFFMVYRSKTTLKKLNEQQS